ncbi:hypothetical protein AC1031_009040 [Aphanomyces cochlioides]|nr:hypothetical protein AC1031_009040 [Aphanomyces cochlioides]
MATDQHAGTLWEKVFQHFQSNIPRTTRSASGLQSRWSNPIQKDVNKFVGILSAVLREYHSGWQFGDYVTLAKQRFAEKNNHKQFKFESVYNILNKRLPKYSINVDTLERNVLSVWNCRMLNGCLILACRLGFWLFSSHG